MELCLIRFSEETEYLICDSWYNTEYWIKIFDNKG